MEDSFQSRLEERARELAPTALEVLSKIAQGQNPGGWCYRIRSQSMVAAAKIVLGVANGVLPSVTMRDIEALERLHDLKNRRLELAQKLDALNSIPDDAREGLVHFLNQNDLSIGEFLQMPARDRSAVLQEALQRAQEPQAQAV